MDVEQTVVQEPQRPEEIWDFKQVVEYLKISAPTCRKLISRGELPMFKVGHHWRGYRRDFENLGKSVVQ